jgi:hypothetical protein
MSKFDQTQKEEQVAPADIILPSLAHFLENDTEEVKQFFKNTAEVEKTIPTCLFPSSAKFIGFTRGNALFRTYFHGKTTTADVTFSSFPERYHPCLFIISHKKNNRYYSVTSDIEHQVLKNVFEN